MSAHASASQPGATSSILRPRAWVGGGFIALLALAVWLGSGARDAAAAAECPNEAIRIAQGATRLPDCRAYERVSPADSTGGVVGVDSRNKPMFGAIRADGDAATFGSSSAVGDAERGALVTSNIAHRSSSGWSSFGVMTTTEPSVPMDLSMALAWSTPSADMSQMMFVAGRSLGPPNPVSVGGSVYLGAPQGQGPPTWLSRWESEGTQPNPLTGNALPLGGSADLSSGYFRYATPLTSIAGDNLRTSRYGIYYFEGTDVRPAAVLPSGTVSPEGAYPAGSTLKATTAGTNTIISEIAGNQVSVDGSRLFFVSPAEGATPKQLYVTERGETARLVSGDAEGNAAAGGITRLTGDIQAPTTGTPGISASYARATADGSKVLFRSEAALTEDAPGSGVKTYRADITANSITLEYLPAVNGYPLTVDDDASHILFWVSDVSGLSSYYVWDEDRPSLPYTVVTNLPTAQRPMVAPELTGDGETLVFSSGGEVEPGVAPLSEASYLQVYRWTQQSETTTCVSCRRDGGTPSRYGARSSNFTGLPVDNPAFPNGSTAEYSTQSSVIGSRAMSRDGSRVFFDTSDPLDPARDVNGVRDVYMWEDGQVHLLTSGRGSTPTLILDNSESGDDVMLVTKDGLVPSDTNQTYDVYDVRVGGGFDESVEAGCEGDACQAQPSVPRAALLPTSSSVRGPGNYHQTRLGQLKVAQLGKPGNSARVRVNVPAAGQVKLAGNLVQNKGQGVKAKGAVTLKVALNKAGKRKLVAKGQLSTKVTTTFRDGDGRTRQSSVTLRFKQGAN